MLTRITGNRHAVRAARALTWRLAVPLARGRPRARARAGSLAGGAVTVITVNWNSWDYLTVVLDVLRRRSPPDTRVLVVDNGSVDGSRRELEKRTDVETICLPMNLGHDRALDLGVLSCRTEFFITLDVDAFPLHERWISELLEPLHQGAEISGARLWRPFVHPCCLAMRTARFACADTPSALTTDRTRARASPRGTSARRSPPAKRRTCTSSIISQRGPGDIGTVFGDVVYHHFYGTRFGAGQAELDSGVVPDDPRSAWAEALDRYVR